MSGHPGQHSGWREAMQTGATNLLNIDLERNGMHDVAPCSSLFGANFQGMTTP